MLKTTLEMPEAVFRQAKSNAAQKGIPLRQFITEAVEDKLRAESAAPRKPWIALAGQLRGLRRENERINRAIEAEFERIEPKQWT